MLAGNWIFCFSQDMGSSSSSSIDCAIGKWSSNYVISCNLELRAFQSTSHENSELLDY